ncbi:AAA family ATPase [Neomicrococcus aestuarii]|uniref:CobQ/CobB/MinD/ParA nucleotide binding domain-containing protein n=1 Tax=Neomicrococcus aestuarii TaxID=556325 RepID=A0A1L2ZKQ5_9MICC|nr:P-loop NTPase [Neomicrococcus aestuarii]APF39716.1 hypothetical protein BHE16_00310 [Neomicrococcus aestuarii]
MRVSLAVWGDGDDWTQRIEQLHSDVTVVRQCVDLPEAVSLADSGLIDATLLTGSWEDVDAELIDALIAAGTAVIALVADADVSARLRSLGVAIENPLADPQSVADLIELQTMAASPRARSSFPSRPDNAGRSARPSHRSMPSAEQPGETEDSQYDDAASARAEVVVVWGPQGAPGKTTIAVNFAAEAAAQGRRVALIDADTYGAAVASHLGLFDEAAGVGILCRLADEATPASRLMERALVRVSLAGVNLLVATGLPRSSRWPEIRPQSLMRAIKELRHELDLIVVDVASPLEMDEDLSFDTTAPQRNAVAAELVKQADRVIAVGRSDAVGIPRMVKAVDEILTRTPEANLEVYFNKVRAAAVGPTPETQIAESWERFGPKISISGFLPFDGHAADTALLSGTALIESAPKSSLRKAIVKLLGDRDLPQRPKIVRQSRRLATFGRRKG